MVVLCTAIIYIMLHNAVIAVIIFIVVVIAVWLLALRHRYATACKLQHALLQVKPSLNWKLQL